MQCHSRSNQKVRIVDVQEMLQRTGPVDRLLEVEMNTMWPIHKSDDSVILSRKRDWMLTLRSAIEKADIDPHTKGSEENLTTASFDENSANICILKLIDRAVMPFFNRFTNSRYLLLSALHLLYIYFPCTLWRAVVQHARFVFLSLPNILQINI